MYWYRLIKSINLPKEHITEDLSEFDELVDLQEKELGILKDLKKEDEEALTKKESDHSETQKLYNKTNMLPGNFLPTTDNYNSEI